MKTSNRKINLLSYMLLGVFFFISLLYIYWSNINGWLFSIFYSTALSYFLMSLPFGIFGIFLGCINLFRLSSYLVKTDNVSYKLILFFFQDVIKISLLLISSFMLIFMSYIYVILPIHTINSWVIAILVLLVLNVSLFLLNPKENKLFWESKFQKPSPSMRGKKELLAIFFLSVMSLIGITLLIIWSVNIAKAGNISTIKNGAKMITWQSLSVIYDVNYVGALFWIFYAQFLLKYLYYLIYRKNMFLLIPYIDSIIFLLIMLKKIFNKRASFITLTHLTLFFMIVSPVLVFVPSVMLLNLKPYDSATTSFKKASFSLNLSTPNRIEIFSDGLDSQNIINSNDSFSKLKDFTLFKNVMTHGFFTDGGFDPIFYGTDVFKKHKSPSVKILNDMRTYEVNHNNSGQYRKTFVNALSDVTEPVSEIWSSFPKKNPSYASRFAGYAKGLEEWLNSGKYLQYMKDKMVVDSNNKKYYSLSSVDWPELKKNANNVEAKLDNYQVLNWRQSKQILSNKAPNFKSPFPASYEAFMSKIEQGEPSYTFIGENMTHGPNYTNAKGDVSLFQGPNARFKPFDYFIDYLARLRKKLMSIKGNIGKGQAENAWDNTEIIIWGDHSMHNREGVDIYENGETRKPISGMLYKPVVKKSTRKHDDLEVMKKPIDGLKIRELIEKWQISLETYQDYNNYLAKNSHDIFLDQGAPILVTRKKSGAKIEKYQNISYWLSKFDEEKQLLVPYSNKESYVLKNIKMNTNSKNRLIVSLPDEKDSSNGEIVWKNSWFVRDFKGNRFTKTDDDKNSQNSNVTLYDLFNYNVK